MGHPISDRRGAFNKRPLEALFVLGLLVALPMPGWGQEQRWFAQVAAQREAAVEARSLAAEDSEPSEPSIRVLLEASATTTVSSPVDGRIVAINTSLGRSFNAGAVLVQFECHEQRARLAIASTERQGAKETYDSKLLMKGLDQASDIEVGLAALEVQKFKSQIDLYKEQVAQCNLVAPWAGATAKLHAKPHMSVSRGAPLIELVGVGRLKGRAYLPSRMIKQVRIGIPLKIDIDETGDTYPAQISHVNSRVDAISQTIEIEIQLQAESKDLLPGMSGQVRFGIARN